MNTDTCSFAYFLEYVLLLFDDDVDEKCEKFSNNKNSASGCCLAFAWFFTKFSLALLMKVFLIKKSSRVVNLSNYLQSKNFAALVFQSLFLITVNFYWLLLKNDIIINYTLSQEFYSPWCVETFQILQTCSILDLN